MDARADSLLIAYPQMEMCRKLIQQSDGDASESESLYLLFSDLCRGAGCVISMSPSLNALPLPSIDKIIDQIVYQNNGLIVFLPVYILVVHRAEAFQFECNAM